jgi:hypothetical protein
MTGAATGWIERFLSDESRGTPQKETAMRINKMLMSLLLISAVGTMGFANQALGASPASVVTSDKASALSAMVGKKVVGKSHEFLGTIVSINGVDKTVELKTETGAIVPIATGLLSVEDDHLRAATMSRGDVLALFRETDKTGVFEVDTAPKPLK